MKLKDKAVDDTYTVNEERPFQLRNRKAYEVEILVPPSLLESLPKGDRIRPAHRKPTRDPLKKPKDRRQGEAILAACTDGTLPRHPITKEFKAALPEALRPHLKRALASR